MLFGLFFMAIIVFLFVFAIGSTIIRGIFGLVFGILHRLFGYKEQPSQQGQQQAKQQTRQSQQSTTTNKGQRNGKIFDKSDGEYVDFEEIKD